MVIPTYQRRGQLPRTLAPLLADPDLLEIVVVVDGSRDGSLELLEELALEEPRLMPIFGENRGIAGARMAGAKAARGDLVLLLDDDVVATPGLVSGHARHHVDARRLVVVGSIPVVDPRQRAPGQFPRALYAREYERHCARWLAAPDTVLKTLWAGNFSLRRDEYLTLEPELELMVRAYHEDVDLGVRLLKHGFTAVFDPALVGHHHYQRDAADHLEDARGSGRNLVRVHTSHRDVLGPLSPDFALAGLPAPARALVRLARRYAWPQALSSAALTWLGRLGRYRLERFVGGLLWRMEQQRAAAGELAGAGSVESPSARAG